MFHSGDYTFVLDIGDCTLDTARLHPTKPRLRITYSDSATCVVRLPWYYASVGFSQIVAVTVLVYFQDKMGWKVGFVVSAAIMASVTLLNLAASSFYVKVRPQKSMWAGLLKVAVVTIKNRDLVLPEANHGAQFHCLPGSAQLVPSDKMR
jgi:hypothetical protein